MKNLDKENNINNNEINFIFSAYSRDKILYIINLFIENDFLNLKYNNKKYKKIEYICKVTYKELKNVKILSTKENLKEIFNSIKDIINNNYKRKNYPLIIKQTNEIILVIPTTNNNDLIFKLDEKEKNIKDIIDELITENEEKDENINQLLNKINLIQSQLDKKEIIINKLENRIIQIELEFERKKNFKEDKKFIKIFPEINLNDKKYEIKKEYYKINKLKIIGQFLKENKQYNGKVIEYYENGNKQYEGDFKNGKRVGKGIL